MTRLDARPPVRAARFLAHASAAAIATLAICMPAVAAKVYRCGNSYQDQPCAEARLAAATPVEKPQQPPREAPCAGTVNDAKGRADCTVRPAPPPAREPAEPRR